MFLCSYIMYDTTKIPYREKTYFYFHDVCGNMDIAENVLGHRTLVNLFMNCYMGLIF